MAKRKKPISHVRPANDKSPDAATGQTATESHPSPVKALPSYLVAIAMIFAFASVALQPVSSDLTWWQLSCGRQAIAEATLRPSADLLINESQGESNAVGAMVSAAIYLLFGASGWMLVRVAVIIAAVGSGLYCSRRWSRNESTPNHNVPVRLACLSLSLAALSPYLDPVPILFDVVATAMVAGWILQRDDARQPSTRVYLPSLAILFLFWANFGNHIFVGMSMIVLAGLSRIGALALTEKSKIIPTLSGLVCTWLVVAIAAMINPIGWRVWVDSFSQTVPWAIAPPWTLAGTDWGPLTHIAWGLSHFVFVLLTLLAFIPLLSPSQRQPHFAVTVVMQFFAWTSSVNIPLAIVWMTVQLLASARYLLVLPGRSQFVTSIVAMVVVSAIMIRTVGWGFDAGLDPRMLEVAIAGSRDSGTILTDDSLSSGMIAWVLGPVKKDDSSGNAIARLHDEPQRALVGGRLVEHRRLFSDLRDSQQMSYWREDESLGGWWLPLTQRRTSLLACSRRDLKLIRRLEPTIWKPLSLDSPVLPYARAGDPIYTSKIVDLLGQRDFVNSGMWDYQPPPSTGSVYDRDRFGLLPASELPDQTFNQADVFAAMDLQIAALEVLDYARQRWPKHPRYLLAWQRCQIELADSERVNVGRASLMRTLASGLATTGMVQGGSGEQQDLVTTFAIGGTEIGQWERLIAVYRKDGASVALQRCEPLVTGTVPTLWESLTQSSREQLHYAAICWAIESGRRDDAMQWAAALKDDQAVSVAVRLLAQHQWVAQNWMDDTPADSQESNR